MSEVHQIMQLYLDCPCTSFPRSFARDFKETYRYPPPSTLYGLLLALIGEDNMTAHLGVQLAIGVIGSDPQISRIVRKQRHHKFSKTHMGTYPTSKFSKPNYHELLTDVQVALKLDSSRETATVTLVDRVAIALSTPENIVRFGGLSLGESWAMLNGVRHYRDSDGEIRWLVKDNRGLISLPRWIDRNTGQGTFERFSVQESSLGFHENCWVQINEMKPLTNTTKRTRRKK